MMVLAGPCQHETLAQSAEIAKECKRVCEKYNIKYYFKASFDKANRTSNDGVRGVGLESTMIDFKTIKETIGVKTLTDVHDVVQVRSIELQFKDAVDVYQIPAFLCRQTDLIKAACATGKIINIKKGQFLAPWDVNGMLTKTKTSKQIWITERGTSFGYNNLVVDFNGIQYMLDNLGVPIIFDATHSCQKPGLFGNESGGNRDNIAGLTRAASALGVTNFFLEVHSDPDKAPSDGSNMIKLHNFERVIHDIVSYSYSR